MKRNTIKRWMGACLLGSAAATGCSQTASEVNDRLPWVAQPVVHPRSNQPVVAQRHIDPPQTQISQGVPTTASPAATVAMLPPAAPAMLPPAASGEQRPAPDPAITQAAFDGSKANPVGEPASARKSFVDLTAHPCFNHAEDYSCLTGQLQHSRISKSWRLRYASVDEVDPYGGSVTLTEDMRLGNLKDGDYVRVRGHLINPDDRGIAPAYQVDSIQPLGNQ